MRYRFRNLKPRAGLIALSLLLVSCASSSDSNPGAQASVGLFSEAELRALPQSGALGGNYRPLFEALVDGASPDELKRLLPDEAPLSQRLSLDDQAFLVRAVQAYLWGYAPMTVYRLEREKTNSLAPPNQFFHAAHLANWQEPSPVSAPNMDVLYSSAFLDLSQGPQVLSIPAVAGYSVVQIDDAFGNSNGSLGQRTVPGNAAARFLLVGPGDPGYLDANAHQADGFDAQHIFPIDTVSAWVIVRVPLNPYAVVGAPDMTSSPSYQANAQYSLAPLVGPQPPPPMNPLIAAKYGVEPRDTFEFYRWLGESIQHNPVPTQVAFQNSILPPYLMSPSPSVGQIQLFASFAEIGLDATGMHFDRLSPRQLALLDLAGHVGKRLLAAGVSFGTGGPDSQNHWHVTATSAIGKYPNTWSGWLVRSVAGLAGGIASLSFDGTYPVTATDGAGLRLQAGHAYSLRFPAGSLPPVAAGGFWSVTCYSDASDSSSQANVPAVSQAGARNVAYSAPATRPTRAIDTSHFRVMSGPSYENLDTIYFPQAPAGLTADTPYFVINKDRVGGQFQLAADWNSNQSLMVPVQVPNEALQQTRSSGIVTPVHSLGLQQLSETSLSGTQMQPGSDGSLEIYLQNQPPQDRRLWSNWLPVPASGQFQLMARLYHPLPATPQSQQPSILSNTTISLTTSDPALAAQYPQQPITQSNRYGTFRLPPIVEGSPK